MNAKLQLYYKTALAAQGASIQAIHHYVLAVAVDADWQAAADKRTAPLALQLLQLF